jgi:uncharacterized protein
MSRRGLFRSIASFAVGAVFSAGLGISGMTRPSKVLGFLDLAGRWDPSLALVMGGAVLIGLASFPWILRHAAPILAPRFILPAPRGVSVDLLLGAGIFGIGWGLSGLCPGPALAALVTGAPPFLIFVASMAAGTIAATRFRAWRRASPAASGEAGAAPAGAIADIEATYS